MSGSLPDIEIKNMVKLFTILLLSEKEQHGYEIMKEVEGRLGRKASPGQIYPFLRQLRKHQYIESEGRSERDKQVYYLTPRGREFVRRISERFQDMFEIAIKPKLTVCAYCSCEIYRGGHKERVGGKNLNFCCESCAKSYLIANKK